MKYNFYLLKKVFLPTMSIGDAFNINNNFLRTYRFFSVPIPLKSLKSKWELDYNVFDLELGRPYYVGKKIIFKPHFGIRGGWLDQKYHLDEVGTDSFSTPYFFITAFERSKSDSWFIGPRVGLDCDWLLGCDFRIFANLAGSLTFQKYKVSIFEENQEGVVVVTQAIFNFKNRDNYLMPNVEFATGLGYGRYFYNNKWYFDFSAGYDFHYLWNQNKITNLLDRQ